VFRLQLANPHGVVLLGSSSSQFGFLFPDGELAQLPGPVNADFAGPKGLDHFACRMGAEDLFHLGHVAGGYARGLGNLFPAVEPPIFRQF
jgi:hypothetical protein